MKVSITTYDDYKALNDANALLKQFAKEAQPMCVYDGYSFCAVLDIDDADLDILKRAVEDNNAGKPLSGRMLLLYS